MQSASAKDNSQQAEKPDEDEETQQDEKQQARRLSNQKYARKHRLRSKEASENLQETYRDQSQRNKDLRDEEARLREGVVDLRAVLEMHRDCPGSQAQQLKALESQETEMERRQLTPAPPPGMIDPRLLLADQQRSRGEMPTRYPLEGFGAEVARPHGRTLKDALARVADFHDLQVRQVPASGVRTEMMRQNQACNPAPSRRKSIDTQFPLPEDQYQLPSFLEPEDYIFFPQDSPSTAVLPQTPAIPREHRASGSPSTSSHPNRLRAHTSQTPPPVTNLPPNADLSSTLQPPQPWQSDTPHNPEDDLFSPPTQELNPRQKEDPNEQMYPSWEETKRIFHPIDLSLFDEDNNEPLDVDGWLAEWVSLSFPESVDNDVGSCKTALGMPDVVPVGRECDAGGSSLVSGGEEEYDVTDFIEEQCLDSDPVVCREDWSFR